MKKNIITLIFILLCQSLLLAQTLSFSSPSEACLGEKILIQNNSSVEYEKFEWDFCEGDLLEPVESIVPAVYNQIDQAAGIRVIEDNGLYFGFVIDRSSNSLFRFEYGSSLINLPSVQRVDLSSTIALSSPQGIDFIKVSNNWFGFLSSSGNNKVIRLDFGSSLENIPSDTELDFGTHLNSPTELEIAREGSEYFLLVINFNSNNLIAANLGSIITNGSPLSFQVTSITGSSGLYGLSVRKYQDGKWRGVVSSYNNSSFQSVNFENGLNSIPDVTSLTNLMPAIQNPVKLSLANWGEENVLLVMAYGGSIHRIHFERGSLFSSVISSDILINSLGPTLPLSLFYDKGNWKAFTFTIVSRALVVFNFNRSCSQITMPYYFGASPPLVNYNASLLTDITLRANQNGILETLTKELLVSTGVAPSIEFVSNGLCSQSTISFNSLASSPINQFSWSFGDTQISTDPNPTHQYSSSGEYTVSLQVTATNGCKNFTEKIIKIYDPPSSTFTSPTGLICTNNEFTFANNTVDNFDGNLTYQWLVNDQSVSSSRDLQYSFTGTGDQSVKLISSIPGCASEAIQVISNVQSGPTVGFEVAGKCEDEIISFTNTSSGDIASYSWNFGNSQNSLETNPNQTYSNPGNYQVSLQSTGTNGCVSTTSKNVVIYSKPQTNFSIEAPPFSCAGTASQFNDLTPAMSDSNLSSWSWTFGDGVNNTATVKNPTHLYAAAGDYNVSLSTTTNFGCSASIQKTISILPSPTASFTNGIACLNQNVQFVNTSGAGLKSSSWNIQNTIFNATNPPLQRFTSAGDYPVQLTVTAANDCRNTITKTISIKSPPQLDFITDKPCTGNDTKFTLRASGGNDPLASLIWDFDSPTTQKLGTPIILNFDQAGIYPVKMNYVGESGCTYSVNKNISIVEGPIASFTASDDVGASPLVVSFTNQSIPNDLDFLWTFKKGNTSIGFNTSIQPNFTFTELGDYTVELKATNLSNGCFDQFVLPIQVVVPSFKVSLSDFKLIDLAGGAKQAVVTVQNDSNVPIVNPEVLLDISGGPLIKEQAIGKIKPGQSLEKIFSASVLPRSLDYACAELMVIDSELMDNRKCISLATDPILFSPFPNPAADHLFFEWISNSASEAEVWIYSTSGQRVFKQSWTNVITGLNRIDIPTSELGNGLFFFTFRQGNIQETFRFMVNKE